MLLFWFDCSLDSYSPLEANGKVVVTGIISQLMKGLVDERGTLSEKAPL